MYLILGCNEISYEISERLKKAGAELLLVDSSQEKLLELTDLNVKVGDFCSPEFLKQVGIEKANTIFISTLQFDKTLRALDAINQLKKELKINPVVLVLVPDALVEREVKKLGATEAIPVPQVLGQIVFKEFERARERVNEMRLRSLLQEARGRMLILTHTNPDPDAIASAIALKTYAKAFGVEADIAYDGEMGYPQNKAMCNLLQIELLEAERVNFKEYMNFALVDVATKAYCALPKEIVPTIIVDHHSIPPSEVSGRLVELAPVGATSTILANYLEYAGIPAQGALASALVLGILTDTSNLSNATPADVETYWKLRRACDPQILRVMQQPPYSSKMLSALSIALRKAKMVGPCLITTVGEIEEEDIVSQVCNFLTGTEGITTVVVYGILNGFVRISARTNDPTLHLGRAFSEAFGKFGGGHQSMAGAKVPFYQTPTRSQINTLIRKLLQALGLKSKRGRVSKKGP
jgi:nanoRNase/pAp phosphatase (c-di-AMP/oligoRNAs hydrolase)